MLLMTAEYVSEQLFATCELYETVVALYPTVVVSSNMLTYCPSKSSSKLNISIKDVGRPLTLLSF